MAEPATRENLKQYALRALGKPVIEINADDDQLEDRLDEALQYFAQYHYDGIQRAYLKYQYTQTDKDRIKTDSSESVTKNGITTTWKEGQGYVVVPESVISVINIFPFSNKGSMNLFDVRYQMRLNDLYDFSSTEYIVIECYRKMDPTVHSDVYNDLFLKRYVTALFKKQWGANLSKFDGVAMIGGVTLNGRQIYSEALSDIEKLEQEIRSTFELNPAMMIG